MGRKQKLKIKKSLWYSWELNELPTDDKINIGERFWVTCEDLKGNRYVDSLYWRGSDSGFEDEQGYGIPRTHKFIAYAAYIEPEPYEGE